jgi:hypothetical protein
LSGSAACTAATVVNAQTIARDAQRGERMYMRTSGSGDGVDPTTHLPEQAGIHLIIGACR